jgi:hypothetical protein
VGLSSHKITFFSKTISVTEPKVFLSSPAPRSHKIRLRLQPQLQIVLKDTHLVHFFLHNDRIRTVKIYKITSATIILSIKFLQACGAGARPQFVISALAPAPGGNLLSAPWSSGSATLPTMLEFRIVKTLLRTYLWGRVHSKLQLGLLAVVDGEALHEEGGEAGTGSAAE